MSEQGRSMNQLTIGFDYGTLDPDTRQTVEACRDDIKRRERRAAEDIIEIGRRLVEAKSALGHGRFLPWLSGEFGYSERTAQNFMNVFHAFGENTQNLRISPSALIALASGTVPDAVRSEFIAKAEAG